MEMPANLSQLNATVTQARLMLNTMTEQFCAQARSMNAPEDVMRAAADLGNAANKLADAVLAWTMKRNGGVQ